MSLSKSTSSQLFLRSIPPIRAGRSSNVSRQSFTSITHDQRSNPRTIRFPCHSRASSSLNSSSLPNSEHQDADSPPLTFGQQFGGPLTSFLLFTSLSLITLKYLWSRLTFEELQIKENARLKALKEELDQLREEVERVEAGGRPNLSELGKGKDGIAKSAWWKVW